jgi:hypothetical protein
MNRPPTVVKIDVEGAEARVFAGATRILSASKPSAWIVELHDEQNESQVLPLLRAHGYTDRPIEAALVDKPYPRHALAISCTAEARR